MTREFASRVGEPMPGLPLARPIKGSSSQVRDELVHPRRSAGTDEGAPRGRSVGFFQQSPRFGTVVAHRPALVEARGGERMLSRVRSGAVIGIDAVIVEVEVDMAIGLP